MADTKKNEVVVKKDAGLPSGMEGYDLDFITADAGLGNEELDANDIAIPFLGILQGLSPQVNEGKEAYIEGARASMLFNNVTGETFEARKDGVLIVPAYYNKKWNVWLDRDSGGGLIDVYDDDSILKDTVKNAKKQSVIKDNPTMIVVETAYHYVLMLDKKTGEMQRMVIGLKSTGLRANRKFNHAITSAKVPGHPTVSAPRFMFAYNLTTFLEEKNDNSWWSPSFERVKDPVSRSVYDEAKSYYELVKGGNIKIAEEPSDGNYTNGSGNQSGEKSDVNEDEIPF